MKDGSRGPSITMSTPRRSSPRLHAAVVLVVATLLHLSGGAAQEDSLKGVRFLQPMPGQRFHDVDSVDASEFFREGLGRMLEEEVLWELRINDAAVTTLPLTSEQPITAVRMHNHTAGRHDVCLVPLNAASTGALLHGEVRVAYFVSGGSSARWDGIEERTPFDAEDPLEVGRRRRALLAWAKKHGSGFDKVEVGDDGFGGATLFAREAMQHGEVIGELRYDATISPDVGPRSRYPALVERLYSDARMPPDLAACLFLLLELDPGGSGGQGPEDAPSSRDSDDQGKAGGGTLQAPSEADQIEDGAAGEHAPSFFQAYLDLLPRAHQMDGALFWSKNVRRVAAAMSDSLAAAVQHQEEYFERVYERLFSVAESLLAGEAKGVPGVLDGRFSREKVRWALSLLLSRAWTHEGYSLPGGAAPPRLATGLHRLVPLADLANHAEPCNPCIE
ncbi:hypothetical protein T484DRAFT_1880501, partial [Baffinella frigidus]